MRSLVCLVFMNENELNAAAAAALVHELLIAL
jgi:hypothetical protein